MSSYGPEGTSEETLRFFICQKFEWKKPQIIFCIEGPGIMDYEPDLKSFQWK